MSQIPADFDRCQYVATDGKRCRLLRRPDDILCTPHSLVYTAAQGESPTLSNDLLGPLDSLESARGVQRFLRRVIRAVADNRVDARQASSLAYLGQLAMHTLSQIRREAAPPARPVTDESPFRLLVALLSTGTADEVLALRRVFQRGMNSAQVAEQANENSPSEWADQIISSLAGDATPEEIASLESMLQRVISVAARRANPPSPAPEQSAPDSELSTLDLQPESSAAGH